MKIVQFSKRVSLWVMVLGLLVSMTASARDLTQNYSLVDAMQSATVEDGNAVINIESITTGTASDNVTDYVCRAGNFVTKVYFRGEVVEI